MRGDAAEGHRSTWAHADFPEQHLAQLAHGLLGEVGRANRDTAGRNDSICMFAGAAKGRFHSHRIIFDYTHVDNLATQAREHAIERVTIGVVDATGIQNFADRA